MPSATHPDDEIDFEDLIDFHDDDSDDDDDGDDDDDNGNDDDDHGNDDDDDKKVLSGVAKCNAP